CGGGTILRPEARGYHRQHDRHPERGAEVYRQEGSGHGGRGRVGRGARTRWSRRTANMRTGRLRLQAGPTRCRPERSRGARTSSKAEDLGITNKASDQSSIIYTKNYLL